MISKHILLIIFLNKPELIFLHTVKWFHLISNNSFLYKYSILFEYSFGLLTVQFEIIQLSISTV